MRKRKLNSCHASKAKFMYEAIYGIIILFVFALIAVNVYPVYNDLNNEIQNSDDISATTKLHSATQYARFDDTTDGLVLFIAVFLFIVFLGLSYFSYEHPIILIVLIILLLAMLIVGAVLANAWEDVTDDPEIATLATQLPVTNYLMNNFLMYVLVILIGCGTVIFMRTKS